MSTDADEGRPEARIPRYHGEVFDEDARPTTRSLRDPLEFRRTQEVIRRHLPAGRVLDVGGGTGHHARALLETGYDVELIDPVARHVEAARARGVPARIGDARRRETPDDAVDGVLLLGRLHPLDRHEDRLRALHEAARITRAGGVVLAAALSRTIGFATPFLDPPLPEHLPARWQRLLIQGEAPEESRFPAEHFHTAEELEAELEDAASSPSRWSASMVRARCCRSRYPNRTRRRGGRGAG